MADHDSRPLVERATRGDPQAIDALLTCHYPALLAYVRLHADPLLRKHESCRDIVQSICRDALEDAADFEYRGEGQFRHWLLQRAMSKLINNKRHYLTQKRDVGRARSITASDDRGGLEHLYATIASPSENAIAHETAERLEAAFDQLSDDQRRVVVLAKVVGLSHAEIADEMQRAPGAVRILLHRALARVGRLMLEATNEE